MKRFYRIAFIAIFIIAGQASIAQLSPELKKNLTYKTAITFTDKRVVNEYLVDITDTSLLTVRLATRFRRESSFVNSTQVPYMQIENVVIRRKGSAGRGALIGLLSGVVLGGITGAVTYKDCGDCFLDFGIGFDIAIGAFLGSVGGTLTGLIIGSVAKHRFYINGNKEKFHEMQLSVLDMAYRKPKQ